jgi:glutamate/tyrosine decarboxylase-like PLP-dependent enzyme
VDTPLRLTADQMRELGYRAVDRIVEHLTTLGDQPVGTMPDRARLEKLFAHKAPDDGSDPLAVLDEATREVLGAIAHTDHPRFLAYIPGPSTYVGAVADFLAAGYNVFAGQWLVGPGPAVVERVTVDWLRELCGLPDTAGGLFVSGGTMANLIAVHAARVRNGTGAVYLTAHTHGSIRKGLRFLGFADADVHTVPTDAEGRMSVAALRDQLDRDRRAGTRPFCVVATAGTTSTGAVDPLDDLADLCARHGLWLHVDGAYGAAAVLSESARNLLSGLDRADSVAIDPHKWWYQPYEIGCVLVRDATALVDAFGMNAEYLRETRLGTGPLNYYDLGPQLTRSFRALKVWMSVKTFGLEAFRRAVDHGIALTEHAQTLIAADHAWEIVTPAQLAILTFRPHRPELTEPEVDALTRRVATATLADGYALVTTTELDGRPVLRFCITNPETTEHDVEQTLALLHRLCDV